MKRIYTLGRILLWSLLLLFFGLIYNQAIAYPGCTDPMANNFDPLATINDGSCCYDDYITVDLTALSPLDATVTGTFLSIALAPLGPIATTLTQGKICTTEPCLIIRLNDTSDNTIDNLNVWIRKNGITLANAAVVGNPTPVCYIVKGTTAVKYNWAVNAPSTCAEVEFGCTDLVACNYNPFATIDDGSCFYPQIYYRDLDADGYGDLNNPIASCFFPNGYVTNSLDCDDTNASIHPNATEIWNGVDDNCNSLVDEIPPPAPLAIIGTTAVCANVILNFSIVPIPGATSYTWSIASGGIILSGQGSTNITASVNNSYWLNPSKFLCVTSNNIYGSSLPTCVYLTDACIVPPVSPSGISGAGSVCINADHTYSILAVPTATSYNWTCSPGISILSGQGTLSVVIEVTDWQPLSEKYLYVQAVNIGGSSTAISKRIKNCLAPQNDSFSEAANLILSGNAYPSCSVYSGNLAHAATSSESGDVANDIWYQFTAVSNGCSMRATPTGFDVVLELYTSAGTLLNTENVTGNGINEILNYGALTVGNNYKLCIRKTAPSTADAPFLFCAKLIVASNCSDGSGTYDMCTNLKAKWIGATSYTFNFTPVSPTPGLPTSATTQSHVALSLASLALQHGGIYDVTVDANVALADGAGTPEVLVIYANAPNSITIAPHANLQVKLQQRCSYPASLSKGTILQGKPFVCGALNHSIEFQRVTDCGGLTAIGLPFTANTIAATSNIALSTVANITSGHYYKTRWKPNFNYGPGSYGTYQVIYVSVPISTFDDLIETIATNDAAKTISIETDLVDLKATIGLEIYPNPNNGQDIYLHLTNVESGYIIINIIDQLGKNIYEKRWNAERSVKAIPLNHRLSAGTYMVRVEFSGEVVTERLFVN